MAKTNWTHTGVWASFDYFFENSSWRGVPITDLPNEARRGIRDYKTPRGGSRSRAQLLRYQNAILTDHKTISSATGVLIQKMGDRRHSGFQEFYHLLEGPGRSVDFSVDLYEDGYIELTDVGNLAHNPKNSRYISDGLLLLAESLKLPIPYELENKWVKQMFDHAERDFEDLEFLAERDKRDRAWIEEAFVRGLEVSGHIPHLTQPHRQYHHIIDICERVAQRRKVASAAA